MVSGLQESPLSRAPTPSSLRSVPSHYRDEGRPGPIGTALIHAQGRAEDAGRRDVGGVTGGGGAQCCHRDQSPLATERDFQKSAPTPSPTPTSPRPSLDLGRYSRSRLRAEARPRRKRKRWTGRSAHPAAPCARSAWPGVLSAAGTAWSQRAGGWARPAPSDSGSWNPHRGSPGARVT